MADVQDLTESLAMIRESAAAIVPRGDLRRVRAQRFAAPGFDRTIWRKMASLGWPGLLVPEAKGGSGLGMRAFAVLAEELGAGLVPEPLIPAVMAARVLEGEPLAALLSGESLVIPAWQEHANSLELAESATLDHGGRISGTKCFVPMAGGADAFLVSTREGLALVPRGAPGLTLTLERRQDGGFYGTLALEAVPATPVPGNLTRPLEEATLAVAATLVGLTRRALAMTLDYLKTRVQFGQPVGSFQALKHRVADLKIEYELARASVAQAAAVLDGETSPSRCAAAVSRAKARASDTALLVTRQAIQLHGAIGYTDEHDIGLFLRKAMVLANFCGSAAVHRARWAALLPEEEAP